jgi:hypothetical protein
MNGGLKGGLELKRPRKLKCDGRAAQAQQIEKGEEVVLISTPCMKNRNTMIYLWGTPCFTGNQAEIKKFIFLGGFTHKCLSSVSHKAH